MRIWFGIKWFVNRSVSEVISFYTSTPFFFQTTRLRALFIQDLSGPVLQMLGTLYPYSIFLLTNAYQTMNPGITLNHFSGHHPLTGFHHIFKEKSGQASVTVSLVWPLASELSLWRAWLDITITLPFPRTMVSTNNYCADTWLVGSQTIDTRAPFNLNSSLSLISIPVFLILTSVLSQPTPDLGSSVSIRHPRYQRKHHHFVSSQSKFANNDGKVFTYAYSLGWCVERGSQHDQLIYLLKVQAKACTGKA